MKTQKPLETTDIKKTLSKSRPAKTILFEVEEAREGTLLEEGFFSNKIVPVTEIFFRVNILLPVVESEGSKKPQVGYESYCSGYHYSGPVIAHYRPDTFLLNDRRYKLVLNRNQDFHKSIKGLAYFIIHRRSPILERWGGWNNGFNESHFKDFPKPNYQIKYSSPKLEKRIIEI